MIGGLLGPVGLVVGPVIAPVIQIADDIAAPVIQIADEAAGSVLREVDKVASPVAKHTAATIHRAAMTVDRAAVRILKRVKKHAPVPIKKLLPKSSHSTGYVNVFDDSASGSYKIGKSIHPEVRLKQVKSPSGAKPKIVCKIPTYNMNALEGSLRRTYASQNLPNSGAGVEWFNLSNAQVKATCG